MTPRVVVIIPWRGGCPWRARALQMVTSWWRGHHPSWPVAVSAHEDGPWRKAIAIDRGAKAADADVLVIADADLIPRGAGEAVAAVNGGAPWAVPMHGVCRLTEQATAAIETEWARNNPEPGGIFDPPDVAQLRQWQLERKYVVKLGGGCVVLSADTWRMVPMDPRFAGWLCEDVSWALALSALAGGPWRGHQTAVHLWHPRAQCEDRRYGSPQNYALWCRYRAAVTRPLMQALVNEAIVELANMADPAGPVLS